MVSQNLKDNKWLGNLLKNVKIKNIAGCYGKQEPLDISNPNDVRDLYYLFGKDRKVQSKDPFFHNANSIIKKKLWEKNKLALIGSGLGELIQFFFASSNLPSECLKDA